MTCFNQMGPMGQGPMTGRKMGRCTNFGVGEKKLQAETNSPPNEEIDERTYGSGFGRGMRWGQQGRGLGRQNRFRGGF